MVANVLVSKSFDSSGVLTYCVFRLTDIIPPANERVPISSRSFCTELLPVILLYYATAVLVVIPRTFEFRLVLLPITLWSAFRAITSVDIALAWNEPGFKCFDFGLGVSGVQMCNDPSGLTR